MINVVFFQRKQQKLGQFSVEIYFKQVASFLPNEISVKVVTMPFISVGFFRRLYNIIYCFFKQGDVNHITGDIHYTAMLLKKNKTILTILDCGTLMDFKGMKKIIFKTFWYDLPIMKSRYITAISNATKNDILKLTNCKEENIKVIYFLSNTKFKKNVKIFNSDEPILLQIGTAPNKNINRLIESIKDFNCKLIIVGKVDEKLKQKLISNNIKYKLYETRLSDEEIENLYINSDVITFASTLEGFGMPIIEGNTIGRIVVTSNVTSMPEIAADSAILVDPFSVNSIRSGILTAIFDINKRENCIQSGFKNAERFNASFIANQYAELYREIVKK